MASPKTRLTDLKLQRFAMVDAGDNPGAHVLISKRKGDKMPKHPPKKPKHPTKTDEEGKDTVPNHPKKTIAERFKSWIFNAPVEKMPRTTAQIMAEDKFQNEFWMLKDAFVTSVHTILRGAEGNESAALLQQSVSEFNDGLQDITPAMKARAPDASAKLLDICEKLKQTTGAQACKTAKSREDFVEALAQLEAFEMPQLPHSQEEPPMSAKSAKSFEEILATVTDEDTRKALKEAHEATLKSDDKPPAKPAEKSKDDDADDADDETLKGLSPEVRKRILDAEKVAKDAKDDVAKLTETAKAQEYLAKAKAKGLEGVDVKALAKAMRFADEGDDNAKAFVETLDALGAQAAKGRKFLTGTNGTRRGDEGGDVQKRVDAKAADLRKVRPELTKEQAEAQVLRDEPALYNELNAEFEDDA